jgi:hypothetical protein
MTYYKILCISRINCTIAAKKILDIWIRMPSADPDPDPGSRPKLKTDPSGYGSGTLKIIHINSVIIALPPFLDTGYALPQVLLSLNKCVLL